MQTVVIVDDSKIELTLYGHVLKSLDEVQDIPFDSSASALRWCEQNDSDLILLDYSMPAPDGLEFIEHFYNVTGKSDIPVVMITSEQDRYVRHRALELGADGFLTKPVDTSELRARVKNMLRVRRQSHLLADRAAHLAEEVRRATAVLLDSEWETIFRLTRAAEHRDQGVGDHIVRIGLFAARVGRALGLSREEQELLRLAAPMHDIGKIGIPDEILLKKGALAPDEREIMQAHTIAGYDILRDSRSPLLQKGAEIALSHHERFDGTGYPFGLKGEGVSLFGRITALCDVFDALLSRRTYKQPWTLSRVTAYIADQEGRHFDPRVVAAFKEALPDILAIRAQSIERQIALARETPDAE